MKSDKIGVGVPEILIPDESVNMKKWAVLACDQYTTNQKYWSDVEKFVGSSPSALHIMLPEIYLDSDTKEERIEYAKTTMRQYIEDDVLKLLPEGFILVERTLHGAPRKGLMVMVDLDQYHYDVSRRPVIRATEETLLERIPPRMEIRKGADIEMPHIMLLMDDPDDTVIGPIWQIRDSLPVIYDFELMQNGGPIKGYFVENRDILKNALDAMERLPQRDGMTFCVGDGNHSLATAKAVWEHAKQVMSEKEAAESPLRYALVELINLHDTALTFEPIHRVLFNVNPTQCVQYVVDKLNSTGASSRLVFSKRRIAMQQSDSAADENIFFTSKDSGGRIEITAPNHPLAVGMLQPILEQFARENPSSRLEYVHGTAELEELAKGYDTLGFFMPALKKEDFFDTLAECGVLPKKTFSLGEADEKRFYLECRLLAQVEVVEHEPEEQRKPSVDQDEIEYLEEDDAADMLDK